MLLSVIVITETRYGGVYEGGPWAAFSLSPPGTPPDEAFSGDTYACDWWDQPTVPVGVGDSPDEALAVLQLLIDRDRNHEEVGCFAPGESVQVARCAPDAWCPQSIGVVQAVEFRPSRPYVGGVRGLLRGPGRLA